MNNIIVDGHCDTLTKILDGKTLSINDNRNHVNIESLGAGNVGAQFFAAWIGDKTVYGPSLQRALLLIDCYNKMTDDYQHIFYRINEFADIDKAVQNNKIASILSIEGGEALEGRIENLRIFYELGVRSMTLTWNNRNEIADGVMENSGGCGLSNFGIMVVEEMNRLGMLVCVSHLSEEGYYDVLSRTQKPVAATHSNSFSICPHPRNLKDCQIKELASNRGIMGINFYPPFLSKTRADLYSIIKHIEYIAGLVGIEILGFGADFDGIDSTPDGIEGPKAYNIIINELLKLNYSEEDINKICHGNFIRVLKETLI